MYDLHTHTTFSDGVLIPSELLRRAYASGYSGLAITDHADFSNYESIIYGLLKLKGEIKDISPIKFLVGIEITHLIPSKISVLAEEAKSKGADIVVVHGETIVEPVCEGTNTHALSCKYVDVLAHPGLISYKDAELAAKNGILLEITTRKGHSFTNGHVFKISKEVGVGMVLNNDAHTPSDLVGEEMGRKIVFGCGGDIEDFKNMIRNGGKFF